MDVQQYLEKRQQRDQDEKVYRKKCLRCWQPGFGCFCALVKPFDPNIKFVVLTHPIEARKRIATGRMAHTCLQNSEFYRGNHFENHQRINNLIQDPDNHSVMLYPGLQATNVSALSEPAKKIEFNWKQKFTVFVMDGTWGTTGKMFRLSPNLKVLPQISFTPERRSTFRVRKQPKAHCLSTIEAIHHLIELLGPSRGFNLENKKHDNLMAVFDGLVEEQIELMTTMESNHGKANDRF